MNKDSKCIPEHSKTRNYQQIITDASQILHRGSLMHLRLKISTNVQWLFGEYSTIRRWSSLNIHRALLLKKHRQWFAKNFNASIGNLGHREMLPHEYHEFHGIGDYSPKVWLYLPNIAWCLSISIGNASATLKKAQWDRAITFMDTSMYLKMSAFALSAEFWHCGCLGLS